jgi:hypothetical protein
MRENVEGWDESSGLWPDEKAGNDWDTHFTDLTGLGAIT